MTAADLLVVSPIVGLGLGPSAGLAVRMAVQPPSRTAGRDLGSLRVIRASRPVAMVRPPVEHQRL